MRTNKMLICITFTMCFFFVVVVFFNWCIAHIYIETQVISTDCVYIIKHNFAFYKCIVNCKCVKNALLFKMSNIKFCIQSLTITFKNLHFNSNLYIKTP